MIIGIDMGHTLTPGNYGAIGIKNESEETRNVGNLVIKYLECMGHSVVNVTVDEAESQVESLHQRIDKANEQYLDIFVTIHFNAFDGERDGSEIYTYGARVFEEAERVLNNLAELGFNNNGILDGSRLYLVRRSYAPAMLIEIAYIDNEGDMEIYDPEEVAKAIVSGITGESISNHCQN